MAKYRVSIELWENGSRTFLVDVPVKAKLAQKFNYLQSSKPRLLAKLFKSLFSFLAKRVCE